jgi:hypothetical protein
MKLFELPDDVFIIIYKIIFTDSLNMIKTMNKYYRHIFHSATTDDLYYVFKYHQSKPPSVFQWKVIYSNSNFKKEYLCDNTFVRE